MRRRLSILGVAVASTLAMLALPLLSNSGAEAARFTGGNIVVYRVGDGAAPLTNASAAVFLDEFSPAGAPVQSIALPTVAADGNQPLTASGQSRSEGLIARSSDGRFVTATGYAAAPGATGPGGISLTGSDPTAVKRVVGLVDANGIADTSTGLGAATTAKIIRSAATVDGNRLWATGGNGGIVSTTLGSTTTTTVAGGAASNLTSLTVQGGQLFAGGILADRVAAVGTGTPASSASLTGLSGLPDNLLSYGYAFLDLTGAGYAGTTLDTLYVANASSRGGTVDKYRYSGSTWTEAGSVDVPEVFGLVAAPAGAAVSIAVTTPTKLLSLTDPSGSATTFAAGAPSVLETAAANTEYRGVALAPTAAAGPSVYVRTPSSGTAINLSSATATITAFVDSPTGVASVQAKIGTGAFVNATKGAGKIWTAKVPISALTPGAATLSVAATDTAGTPATTTVTRSLTLSGVPAGALGAGNYGWTNKLVKRTGTWKGFKASGLKSKTAKAHVDLKAYGKGFVATFGTSKKAGKVKITVDGKSTKLNLYTAKKGSLAKTWTFSGATKTHTVTVTVLGKKTKKSKGTNVFLTTFSVK